MKTENRVTRCPTQRGNSVPPYPYRHSGPVIVAGSAWCLHDDLSRAMAFYGCPPVIAVNGAAGETQAFALFTQHPRKFPQWIGQQRARYGGDFSTHSAGKAHLRTKLGRLQGNPWVEYWWDGIATGGTSAWGARRLAAAMGFDLVILCGVPMEPGPYAYGGLTSKQFREVDGALQGYRDAILRDEAMHEGVVSMSGWTREVFGDA